jgi:hypothetical protein
MLEAAYLIDRGRVPLITVFYSDKSYLKGMTHHPKNSECYIWCMFCIFCRCVHILHILPLVCIFYIKFNFLRGSPQNSRRSAKSSSWIVVAWMPVINEENSRRPSQGYESNAARNTRLCHECWRRFLAKWPEFTKHARARGGSSSPVWGW